MKSVSLKQATQNLKRDFPNRLQKVIGFEHREVGPHTVNILFYSVRFTDEDDDVDFTDWRADVYVDGHKTNGLSF